MSDDTLSAGKRAIFGAIGAGILAAGTAVAAVGTNPPEPASGHYTATFGRAGQGLDPGHSDVKVRGVTVGTVTAVDLNRAGRVAVRIRVARGVRVPATAGAKIEPVSVFGPKDLVLDLGPGEGSGPYLRENATIRDTRDPQELADTAWPTYRLTDAINPEDLATTLRTFSQGLAGQGPALRRTIVNGSRLIDLAHGNRAVIKQLIADIEGLSGTFANRGDTLAGISRDFNDLSPAISGRPDRVAGLLDGAGRLADSVGDTLRDQGDNIGPLLDASGGIVDVFYRQQRNIPVLIDGLNGFFEGISTIIRVPGPEGTLLAQAVNFLPLDICKVIVDICPRSAGPDAFGIPVKKEPG